MSPVGKMGEFCEENEDWSQYVERVEFFFTANGIEGEERKRAVLLTVMGPEAFGLLKRLVEPRKVARESFDSLVAIMRDHLESEPSDIVQRFRFNSRDRKPCESVALFNAELSKLAGRCNFGRVRDDMLRDRLVCGVNDKLIRRRLLSERGLTYERALEIALAIETVPKDAQRTTSSVLPNRQGAMETTTSIVAQPLKKRRLLQHLSPPAMQKISQRMPLTPAERQRRRREKLKMQEQCERYKAIDLTGVRCGVEVVPAWLKSWGLTAEALHATFKGLGLQIIRELCARIKPAPARVRLHLLAARFSRAMCADLCNFIELCLVRLSSEPLIVPGFINHLNDVGRMPGVLGIKVKDKDYISVEEDGRYSEDGTPVDLIAKFPCSKCSFSLSTMAAWQLHMESHRPVSSNKRHKCSTCPYSTDDKSSFRLHARVHTGERPYTCGVCGKTFSQSSHRWQHMRIHNNDRPHSCAVCSKTFNRLTTLQQHTRIHTGERPFVCTMCAKTFSHPSALQQHVRIHTGERPHSCTVCTRTFSRPSALHQHARIHTGERPYTCTVCGKAFRQIAHCRNHMACCKYLKECNTRTIDSPEETTQLSISM